HRLQVGALGAPTVADAAEQAVAALATDPGLVPFALVYLLDGPRRRAQLLAASGMEPGDPAAPRTVALADDDAPWPIDEVARRGSAMVVEAMAGVVLPLRIGRDDRTAGVAVLGLGAGRPLDADYRRFLDDVVARLAAALTDGRSRQQERARQEALVDVDRARTEFFANVSHEFRTPLTLLLGPLDAALAQAPDLPAGVAADLELAHRGALRLLRMVQSLLDFSQTEVGRRRGAFVPTDLSSLTRELVAVFRGVADSAGLALLVDCPPLPEPVWVDPAMWERIVSNLLSNALKFTLEGRIAVSLRLLPSHAELVVTDTGSGIPEADLPHVFERFHRVEGVPARTREGTGIGLALVDDLVRLHHGRVRVQSRLGEGSTFTVWVPRGRRLDEGQPRPPGEAPDPLRLARSHADEALSWTATAGEETRPTSRYPPAVPPAGVGDARILVVDDNADMREYLQRLIGRHWQVDAVADAFKARARLASAEPPDLVLADVMMAEVDGLQLLRELRANPSVAGVPVILLSARAGEEEVVAGLDAGADDYLVKPFSSRELLARIGAQLALSRLRRQRDHALQAGDERLQLALQASGVVAFELDTTTDEVTVLGGDTAVLDGVSADDFARHVALLGRPDATDASVDPVDLADGGVRWIRSVAHPLADAPERLFGVSTDDTARHVADERLAEATNRLRTEVDALTRYQVLSSRLAGRSAVGPIDDLLEDILDAVIELHRADGGSIELDGVVLDRGHTAAAAETDATPLLDRAGHVVGELTLSTRRLPPRSDLEARLAELYLRQARAVVAVRSGAGAGGAGVAAEEPAQEAPDEAGGDEAPDEARADAVEVGVDGLDLTDDDGGVAPDGGEVGG
ncbi:MAG TPA: ATP-binding protein, partial [Acidimicrobiales bacterium]